MSNRPYKGPALVITAGAMAADITSLPTLLPQLTKGSYEVTWTGGSTPIGLLSLEGSDSYSLNPDGSVRNAGTWTTMPVTVNGVVTSTIAVSGNSGSILIDWTTGLNAIRVFYDATSGSGTMTALINAKVG